MEKEVLLLGDPRLYEISEEVNRTEAAAMKDVIADLHDTLMAFRRRYGAGRAIAAPQIGVKKRLIYLHIDTPLVVFNPSLTFPGEERMEVLDDCMSFPGLLVKVKRYRHCVLRFRTENWEARELRLDDDLSELIQHEYDHLDGILATMRAVDNHAFVMKKAEPSLHEGGRKDGIV